MKLFRGIATAGAVAVAAGLCSHAALARKPPHRAFGDDSVMPAGDWRTINRVAGNTIDVFAL